MVTSAQAKNFIENYQPDENFKVDENFPIATNKTVTIKKLPKPERRAGLILNETTNVESAYARIYAVGEDVEGLKVGMIVKYNQNACLVTYHQEEEFYNVSENDIYTMKPEDKDKTLLNIKIQENINVVNSSSKAYQFAEKFIPPIDFIVPDNFDIPCNKFILVKKLDRSFAARKSGLYLGELKQTGVNEGTVFAVGPNVKSYLKPGMNIVWNHFSNNVVDVQGIDYAIIYDMDVQKISLDPTDIMMMENHKVEGRKQYSYDELPDIEDSKEVKQEMQEDAIKTAEFLKKEVTTKHHAVNGQKKN